MPTKISDLPAAGALDGTELIPVVQAGVTKKLTGGFVRASGVSSAAVVLQAASAASVPEIVRGAAAQTADLHQWQSSAAAVLAKIDSAGVLTAAAQTAVPGSSAPFTSLMRTALRTPFGTGLTGANRNGSERYTIGRGSIPSIDGGVFNILAVGDDRDDFVSCLADFDAASNSVIDCRLVGNVYASIDTRLVQAYPGVINSPANPEADYPLPLPAEAANRYVGIATRAAETGSITDRLTVNNAATIANTFVKVKNASLRVVAHGAAGATVALGVMNAAESAHVFRVRNDGLCGAAFFTDPSDTGPYIQAAAGGGSLDLHERGASAWILRFMSGALAKMGWRADGYMQWIAADREATTVGAAGGASALPATPTKYLMVKDSAGSILKIPAYAA